MYDYVQTGKLKCDRFPCDPSAGYKPVKHIYTYSIRKAEYRNVEQDKKKCFS